ncbi:hypothetical protein OIU84_000472 [Salix udensis]|uniref:Pectinesterase n=1 Tax=Salix udensis TaxID=889485 RepID=A0AAD6L6C8_9ROSI|nr:hypothetical protein OIU84_000472 [Salix udensis]
MSACRDSYSVYVFVIVLLLNSGQTLCHTKGLRTGNSGRVPPVINGSRVQFSEQQFMNLKHSVFRAAKNKIFPSYTLIVAKNPSLGDFTTIQEAIDSLPFINLVRVVIKDPEKVSIPPLKSFITVEGAGADNTIVQWGDTAQTPGARGQPMGTYSSATFAVNSPFLYCQEHHIQEYDTVASTRSHGKAGCGVENISRYSSFLGVQILGSAGHTL